MTTIQFEIKPSDLGMPEDWDGDPGFAYDVKLTCDDRTMEFPFFTGSGWTEWPNLGHVLECMCLDASMIENSPTFEDFCAELGYDDDSRKAERAYDATVAQTVKFKELIGDDDAFERLVFPEDTDLFEQLDCDDVFQF